MRKVLENPCRGWGRPRVSDFVAPRRANNLPSAFVDMKRTEQSYKASLVVLLAAQEMSAELLERED